MPPAPVAPAVKSSMSCSFFFDSSWTGPHGDRARDLARGVAAHAVGDDEERELLVDEEVVLVVVADAADVGRGEEADALVLVHRRERLHRGSISKPEAGATAKPPHFATPRRDALVLVYEYDDRRRFRAAPARNPARPRRGHRGGDRRARSIGAGFARRPRGLVSLGLVLSSENRWDSDASRALERVSRCRRRRPGAPCPREIA